MEQQNFNLEAEDQLIYTVNQRIEDDRTYTVDAETVERQTSTASTAVPTVCDPELISVCACLLSGSTDSSKDISVCKQKRNSKFKAETYLREHRISEFIRYMLAKIMCSNPKSVALYVVELLDNCMTFRSGYGKAPVLFEERHLKAVIKSFDPCDRGWLTAGQVRRAYDTLGLTPKTNFEVRTPTQEVLDSLRETQESELLSLLNAGFEMKDEF